MKLVIKARLTMAFFLASGLFFSVSHLSNAQEAQNKSEVISEQPATKSENTAQKQTTTTSKPLPHHGKYEKVVPKQLTSTPNKVELVELFWYTCPHCSYFEKNYFKQWREAKQPAHVEVVHMPAVYGNSDRRLPLAKAFYVAKALGVFEKIHQPLFDAIHVQKRNMNDEKVLKEFFAEYGVSNEDFDKVYHSFWVDTQIRRATDMTKRYGITGVPVIILNGKYRLNSEKAEGYKNLLTILNDLIEVERQEMGLK
jgi:protein dithiol oxidoreductase (disulfide-forming)